MVTFRVSERPDVSVVVLVTREPELVRPSLEALARSLPAELATEVVLVVNTTREDTRAFIADGVGGARIVDSPVNCGTAVAWNVGFALARGAHVALVHEDTHPRPGWLEGLTAAAFATPRALVVTNRILNTDGSTWNAGWIIWRDGWTTTLDELTAPELLASPEPYPVDSASSASMLVDRAGFLEVGGFDERTFPTVTTNVDFALATWRAGRTIVATAQPTVVHATSAMVHAQRGLYSSVLFREFLIRRATRRLRDKWEDGLDRGFVPRDGDRDPTGDRTAHVPAIAATVARAERPPPPATPPSLQSRHLSAPDGGWPTEIDAPTAARLVEAQREVDAEFDTWVLDERARLQARILELDAGVREATRAHDDAIDAIRELEDGARGATQAHDNAVDALRRVTAERDMWKAKANERR